MSAGQSVRKLLGSAQDCILYWELSCRVVWGFCGDRLRRRTLDCLAAGHPGWTFARKHHGCGTVGDHWNHRRSTTLVRGDLLGRKFCREAVDRDLHGAAWRDRILRRPGGGYGGDIDLPATQEAPNLEIWRCPGPEYRAGICLRAHGLFDEWLLLRAGLQSALGNSLPIGSPNARGGRSSDSDL